MITSAASVTAPDPITQIQIPLSMCAEFPPDRLLDFHAHNYRVWARTVRNNLALCGGLKDHLDPAYCCPDPLRFPADARCWRLNDQHVVAFIRIQLSEYELGRLEWNADGASASAAGAAALWAFLKATHVNSRVQAFLLLDLLQLQFQVEAGVPLAVQALKAIQMCEDVIAMGPLDAEVLAQVAMLHMLREEPFLRLRSSLAGEICRSTADRPSTTDKMIRHLEVESARLVVPSTPAPAPKPRRRRR